MIKLFDETLRDGLQSFDYSSLNINQKKEILKLMDDVGIESCNIGFINSSEEENREIVELLKYQQDVQLKIKPYVLSKMSTDDLKSIKELVSVNNIKLSVLVYIAISDYRMNIENWSKSDVIGKIDSVIEFQKLHSLNMSIAFEDTTRANKDLLDMLIDRVNESGFKSLVLADTLGIADFESTKKIVSYVRNLLSKNISLEWHGHNDLGVGVSNSFAAIAGGATRIHTCVLGIGERAGNTSTEQMIINLNMKNLLSEKYDIGKLGRLVNYVSDSLDISIPSNLPIYGKDVFFTCAGTHAAAIYKEYHKNKKIGPKIFTPFKPEMIKRQIEVGVNRTSGISNIKYLNEKYDLNLEDEKMESLLFHIKEKNLFFREKEFVDFATSSLEREKDRY